MLTEMAMRTHHWELEDLVTAASFDEHGKAVKWFFPMPM